MPDINFDQFFVCVGIILMTTLTYANGTQILTGAQITVGYPSSIGHNFLTLDGDNFTVAIADTSALTMITYTKNVRVSTSQVYSGAQYGPKMIRLNSTYLITFWYTATAVNGRICPNSGCTSSATFTVYNGTQSGLNPLVVDAARFGNHTTTPQRFIVVWSAVNTAGTIGYNYGQVYNGDFTSYGAQLNFGSFIDYSETIGVTSVFDGASTWYWIVMMSQGNYIYVDGNSATTGATGSLGSVYTTFTLASSPFGDTNTIGIASINYPKVYFQIVNYQMSTVVAPFVVPYSTSTQSFITVGALIGGSYAVGWSISTSHSTVYGNVVGPTGTRSFTEDVQYADSAGSTNQYIGCLSGFGSGSGGSLQYVASWQDSSSGIIFKIANLPTPSSTPSRSPTPSPSVTASMTPTTSPTPSITPTSTPTASVTPSATTTPTSTPSPTATSSPTTTPTTSSSATSTPSSSFVPSSTPTPTSSPSASSSFVPDSKAKNKDSNLPPVIGGVVGGALFLAALIGGAIFFVKRRKNQKQTFAGHNDL